MAFTFFFRDLQTLEVLCDRLLPQVAGRSRVRIWDAGCALGQEPYTLAIVLAERMNGFAFRNLRIDATDLDPTGQFGPVVEGAAYPEGDLARIPRDLFQRWFERAGEGRCRVKEPVRGCVAFQRHDLLSLRAPGEGYSAIVCKNVLLHLQPAERVEVFRMFHAALAPGGLLALEPTQDVPHAAAALFESVACDARVYRRREVA